MVALGLGTIDRPRRARPGRRAPTAPAQRRLGRRRRGRAVAAAGGRPADQPPGQHPPADRALRVAAGDGDRARRRRSRWRCATSTSGPASNGQLVDTGRFLAPASTGRGALVLVLVGGGRGRRLADRLPRAAGPARRGGRGPAARCGVHGPDLRPAVVLPDAVGLGRDARCSSGRCCGRRSPGGSTRRPDGARPVGDRVALVAAGVAVVDVAWRRRWPSPTPTRPRSGSARPSAALAGPTYQAVVDGVGAATGVDGKYVVRWSDAADIGSPGFGLLDELERRGLDVAADDYFDVPVTKHRVRPRAEADAQIHLATGGYIDVWRDVPDAIEVRQLRPPYAAEQRASTPRRATRLIDRLTSESSAGPGPARRHQPVRHVGRHAAVRGRPGRPRDRWSTSASRWSCSSPRPPPTTTRTRCDASICCDDQPQHRGRPWTFVERARQRSAPPLGGRPGRVLPPVDRRLTSTCRGPRGCWTSAPVTAGSRRSCWPTSVPPPRWSAGMSTTDRRTWRAGRRPHRADEPSGRTGRFDLVLLLDVLEHVDDDEGFLAERWCRPWPSGGPRSSACRRTRASSPTTTACSSTVVATGRPTCGCCWDAISSWSPPARCSRSLLAPRMASVVLERAGRHGDPAGVGAWSGGPAVTSALTAVLRADVAVGRPVGSMGASPVARPVDAGPCCER